MSFNKKHVREAAQIWKKTPAYSGYKASTTYDVIIDGKPYPSKPIVALALELAGGRKLPSSEFRGSIKGKWGEKLKELGFEIVKKNKQQEKFLTVFWCGGEECVPLSDILETIQQKKFGKTITMEERFDGGTVEYQPSLLGGATARHFSLQYNDGGKWFPDGSESDGEEGVATYRYEKKKWTCEWQPNGGEKIQIRCQIETEKPRATKLVRQTVRDRLFRQKILRKYGCKCVISGETLPIALDAAHICEVRAGGTEHEDNGIMLRKDLHALFDANLFQITLEGKYTSTQPSQLSRKYIGLLSGAPRLKLNKGMKGNIKLRKGAISQKGN